MQTFFYISFGFSDISFNFANYLYRYCVMFARIKVLLNVGRLVLKDV